MYYKMGRFPGTIDPVAGNGASQMSDKDNEEKLKNLLMFQIFATDDEMGQLGCLLAPVLIGAAFVLWWWGS